METCQNRLGRLNIDKSSKIQIEEERQLEPKKIASNSNQTLKELKNSFHN